MRRRLATFLAITTMLSGMLVVTGVALAANQAANLDQCANDPSPSLPTDGCDASATQWVNGNLGASKSIYREGDSIAYRMRFTNLVTVADSPTTIHHVIIEWDTTKAGKHAIDYLTTWNRTVNNANPCLGVTFASPAVCNVAAPSDTEAIKPDPQVTGAGVTPIAGVFTMWGGTITSITSGTGNPYNSAGYAYPNGTGFAGDKTARLELNFTATQKNPVLAWGGHIATRQNWPGASAINISGSPYHMRLIDLDGAGGNQDRSLSADAVIFPGRITTVKHAEAPSSTSFGFTATGFTPGSFSLVDSSASTDPSQQSDEILAFGTKTVAETNPLPGYKLTSITCTSDMDNTYTPNIAAGGAGGSVNIALTEGENVTCTFNNVAQNPALSITKDATETSYDTVGQTINYTIVAKNEGNTTLASVTITDTEAVLGACSPANGSSLAPGATMTCSATHVVTQADIDAGTYNNTACVDDGARGAAEVCDDADVPAAQNPHLTISKEAAETGFDSVGDVIHYTIVATNDGNVTLHNVTVTDAQVTDLVCTPTVPVTTLAPGASINCTASHTISQADLDDGSFYNQACVDDSPLTGTGAASVCDDVSTPPDKDPNLSITKEATEAGFDSVGDVIHYTIVATNDGNVTLTGVVVTDAQVSDLVCDPTLPVATLAPGAAITCTASHTITQADLDGTGVYNQACVDDGDGGAAAACDDVTTPPTKNPHLSITKDATETGFDAVGDVIHYSITATNDGNVTLSNVTVTDAQVSDLTCLPSNPATLAPGESINCTASHTITQADLDGTGVYNQACVDDGAGGAASACDDVTTPPTQNPHLAITKEATEAGFDSVGDVIHYTVTATNDGNVTLHNVTVTDAQVSDLVCSPTTPVANLAPGESINCTASHTVTQADLDGTGVYNQACVDDGDGGAASACDDVTTPPTQNPHLSITKDTSFVGKFENVGDVISYTIVATNDGNVTLHNVTVTDAQVTDLVCAPTVPVTDLAPGGTINCTASHTITQADLDAGSFYNQACVDDGAGGAQPACDDVTTTGKNQPAISTEDVLIPQDSITISGLTAGATGTLYAELRINETCGQDGTPAYSKSWTGAAFTGNGTYETDNTVEVSADALIRWCSSYSGDANNAARPLDDRGEVVNIDFDPVLGAAVGFTIPMLAWGLWTLRKRREDESR